jgi:uncharacterized protein (DUF433 family)
MLYNTGMKYITSDPEIMSGNPVIKGTRIPVAVILAQLKQGNTVQEIHEMYNWVSLKKLEGAIDEVSDVVTTTLHAKKVL